MACRSALLSLAIPGCILALTTSANAYGSLEVRVRNELPGALSRMEEFYSRVKGSGSLERKTLDASVIKVHLQRRFKFAIDGASRKFETVDRETGDEKTNCATPRVKYDYWNKKLVMGPGWFVVCPDLGWAVLAFEHEFLANNRDPRYRLGGEIEYAESQGPIPVPRRVSFQRRSGIHTDSNLYLFDAVKHEGTPEWEFTGSQLGLPELDKPLSPRRRSYAPSWLLGLAVATMAAAIFARRAAGYLESKPTGC